MPQHPQSLFPLMSLARSLGRTGRRVRSSRASARPVAAAERLEDRVLLSGQTVAIAGSLWNDQDADGVRDAGEPGLAGRTVYLDANNNGRPDAGEPLAATDGDGDYAFTGLPAGAYIVRQVLPDGWRQSPPGVGSPPAQSSA